MQQTHLQSLQPFNVQTQGVVSGHPSYFDFIAPGIMAMTVMMSVMTGLTSRNFAGERNWHNGRHDGCTSKSGCRFCWVKLWLKLAEA